MKKLAYLLVLLLCMSMTMTAFATEFTPSVTSKPAPEIVPVGDGYVAYLINEAGEKTYLTSECLVVTPVSEAEKSTVLSNEAKTTLLNVHTQLSAGKMKMPYEKHNPNYNAADMVIRDLVDISLICEEHSEMLKQDGVKLVVTFKMGLKANTDLSVMSYKNTEWNPIDKVVVNEDGTATCTFENLCPVAFSVYTGATPPAGTGDNSNTIIWGAIAGVSLVALIVLIVVGRKKKLL